MMLRTLFCHLLFSLSLLSSAWAHAEAKLKIIVSVDWEGEDLRSENLEAMQAFRQDFPEVPLQHFLNAAYYTKKGAQAAQTTQAIRSVLREGDEEGLHIHAWRSLIRASGVPFRTGPSFVGPEVDEANCGLDCGMDVALTAYTKDELRKVLQFSVKLLQKQGFQRAQSFRAGGWQADAKVLDALTEEGFTLDSSATYAPYLKKAWGDYQLYPLVGKLWPQIQPTSQPYRFEGSSGKSLTEVPNNGCLADYMTGTQMLAAFRSNAQLLNQTQETPVYLSIGFHQETAADWLPRLRSGLKLIKDYAAKHKIAYEFVVGPL